MPRVSVNVCCYNSEKFIKDTLQSVLDQTFSDFEIVVVDDGSKDRTGEIVKGFKDPRIKYHYQENRGLSFSRNRALQLSSGEFIALLDHDDLWDPSKLELQLKLFDAEPGTGLVYSGARVIDAEGRRLSDVPQARYRKGRVTAALLGADFITCPTIIFRRSLLGSTGGFNEEFAQVEDYDILLRFSLLTDFSYVPEIVVSYRKHASNASRDLVAVYTEIIRCLSDFASCPGAEGVAQLVKRGIFLNQSLLAMFYLYNSRLAEADTVLAAMAPERLPEKLLYVPALRLLSRLPAGIRRALLRPLKAKGMVSDQAAGA